MEKARILIVEDEAIVAESIARILKTSGYIICAIATSAEEAVGMAEELNPDLIVMDIFLSGKEDGITAAERIHARFSTPIVYTSALSDETTLERAKFTGPYGFIIKPFNARELVNTIDLALYKYSTEVKLKESEKKYRSIFENAMEGIFQIAPDGKFLSVNPALAKILGYDSPEDITSSVTATTRRLYVEPEKRREMAGIMKEKGHVRNFEVELYRKDSSIVWVSINASSSKDAVNDLPCIEGMLQDITFRKEMELKLKESMNRLQKATRAIIDVVSKAVEMRDPYTSGHQKRVAGLARSIAVEMGLPKDRANGVFIAAAIHDLGKITIPAEILSMPRKLSPIEYQLIQFHPQAGYEILKDIEFPWPIAQIVLQHHERRDGSGYPHGLKDGEILVESRIIAVADVVEAIASHRPYRPACGIDAALEEVEKNRGKLYDPEVVDACITLFREKGFVLE